MDETKTGHVPQVPSDMKTRSYHCGLNVWQPVPTDATLPMVDELIVREEFVGTQKYHVLKLGSPGPTWQPSKSPAASNTEAQISFFNDKQHIAYIQLTLKSHQAKNHDHTGPTNNDHVVHESQLYFTMENLQSTPTVKFFHRPDSKDGQPSDITCPAGEIDASAKDLMSCFNTTEPWFCTGSFTSNNKIYSMALFKDMDGQTSPADLEFLKIALQGSSKECPLKFEYIVASMYHKGDQEEGMIAMEKTRPQRVHGLTDYNTLFKQYRCNIMNPLNFVLSKDDCFLTRLFNASERNTFFSAGEYFSLACQSLKLQESNTPIGDYAFGKYAVKFLEIWKYRERGYQMLIDRELSRDSSRTNATRFYVGDIVSVDFSDKQQDESERWLGVVTDNTNISRAGNVTIMIHRRWVDTDQDGRKIDGHWQSVVIPERVCIAADKQKDRDTVRDLLQELSSLIVHIKVISSINHLQRQMNVLDKLWDIRDMPHVKGELEVLLANTPALQEPVHAFEYLLNQHVSNDQLRQALKIAAKDHNLNTQQANFFERLTQPLPGGMILLDGITGSGKSTAALALIDFILASNLSNLSRKVRILCIAPDNARVDRIAHKIQNPPELATQDENGSGARDAIVVRAHGSATEHRLARSNAELKRLKHEVGDSLPREVTADELDKLYTESEMEVATDCLEQFSKQSKHLVQGTSDKRLTSTAYALATLTLDVAGVASQQSEAGEVIDSSSHRLGPTTQEPHIAAYLRRVRDRLKDDADGTNLDEQSTKDLSFAFDQLSEWILAKGVNVLVSTIANACTAKYAKFASEQPIDFMFVFGASLMTEADLLSVYHDYRPRIKILVGDKSEMGPRHINKVKISSSSTSMTLGSPFPRLQQAGVTCVTLLEQMRMPPSICTLVKIINSAAYKDIYASEVAQPRASTSEISKAMKSMLSLSKDTNFAYVHVDSRCTTSEIGPKSSYNLLNTSVTMCLLYGLLRRGIHPSDIVIVTPYRDANNLYSAALHQLVQSMKKMGGKPAEVAKDLVELPIVTIDSLRVLQSSVVLFDTVVTEKNKYLADRGRLTAAVTRATDGIFIVGNATAFRSMGHWQNEPLGRLISQCKAHQVMVEWPKAPKWPIPEVIDFITKYDQFNSRRNVKRYVANGTGEGEEHEEI